ncbi:MAG: hypothetical protein NE334_07875 [Lentisphaeraceae bacterium]|nr:hypothetical protein [Lentisphaeraceae bacterium]
MTTKTIIESFELKLKACVREVPGKRRVFTGSWNNQDVFVKVFEQKNSQDRHFSRELKGLEAFQKNSINTPKVLWHGKLPEINSEKISPDSPAIMSLKVHGTPFDEVFAGAPLDLQKQLGEKLIETVFEHHRSNLIQTDIHPGNFLVDDKKIYSLDGDALLISEKLTDNEKLTNLALLIAQFPVEQEELFTNILSDKDIKLKELFTLLEKARARRCQKYIKKVFRDCTEIKTIFSSGSYSYIKRRIYDDHWQALINDPNSYIPEDTSLLLKNGNTATVAKAQIGTTPVVIKRNNFNKNTATFFKRFKESRSSTCWKNAHRLLNYGLKTPQPLALIEKKLGPVTKRAFFVCETVAGTEALKYFKDNPDEALFQKAVSIFKVYEKCLLTHGDCKATNYIVANGDMYIIDLDSMKQHTDKSSFAKAFKKDLKRWLQNWDDTPELHSQFRDLFKQASFEKYLTL